MAETAGVKPATEETPNKTSIRERVRAFDADGKFRKEIDAGLELLRQFREKYSFKDDPNSIDRLTPDDVYKKGGDYFFRWIEFRLRPLGSIAIGSAAVYHNICDQLEKFKNLLHIAIDPNKSLAQKVDAHWENISGLGGDKHIAKKIISCYDDRILPIFNTKDMRYLISELGETIDLPSKNMSTGQEYEHLMNVLLKAKEKIPETRDWDNPYFSAFLYETFPPQRTGFGPRLPHQEPLNQLGLLFTPQTHDEILFLFSKLHGKIGFPYIIRIQPGYPDVQALDDNKKQKRIEVVASQFNHDKKGCDVIVCWENDLQEVPEGWPKIIQLKDYL